MPYSKIPTIDEKTHQVSYRWLSHEEAREQEMPEPPPITPKPSPLSADTQAFMKVYQGDLANLKVINPEAVKEIEGSGQQHERHFIESIEPHLSRNGYRSRFGRNQDFDMRVAARLAQALITSPEKLKDLAVYDQQGAFDDLDYFKTAEYVLREVAPQVAAELNFFVEPDVDEYVEMRSKKLASQRGYGCDTGGREF